MIQKRIIRIIAGAGYLDHTTPLFLKLKILKITDLYKFSTVIDTFKKRLMGHYAQTHERETRQNDDAKPKFHRLSRTQQSISFKGPTHWNALPAHIRSLNSLHKFKNAAREFYLNQYR